MSGKEFFNIFYSIPNPHFNAFFKGTTGSSEKHPLQDLIDASCDAEQLTLSVDDPSVPTTQSDLTK